MKRGIGFALLLLFSNLPAHAEEPDWQAIAQSLEAPMVGAFSDPNQIRYDKERERLVRLVFDQDQRNAMVSHGWRAIVNVPAEPASHNYGVYVSSLTRLGLHFRERDLLKYLQRRVDGDLRLSREAPVSLSIDVGAILDIVAAARLKPAASQVRKLIDDPDSHIRTKAAICATVIAHDDPVVFEKVTRLLLADGDCYQLGPCMYMFGPDVIPVLLKRLKAHPDIPTIDAIGGCKSNAALAIPALMRLLDDFNPDIAAHAAAGLGNIGPDANNAIPKLLDLKFAGDDYLARYATEALARMSNASRAALLKKGKELGPEAYAYAVSNLGAAVPYESVIQLLTEASKSPDENLRCAVAQAMGTPDARPILDVFIRLLQDPSPKVRAAAVESSSRWRASGLVLLPYLGLVQANEKEDSDIRDSVGAHISSIEADLEPHSSEYETPPADQ